MTDFITVSQFYIDNKITAVERIRTIQKLSNLFSIDCSGIPLHLFDILGCEGFVLTNYQAELPELFDIGNEVIAYSSLDEMCELASYFLDHDKKRREIALNSYEKILHQYNYPTRLDQLLLLAFS